MMKRIIPIFLLSILYLSSGKLNAQRIVKNITDSQELRVGTTATQPPFSLKSTSGTNIGFDIDLARKLAESIEVKVRFVEMNFADLLNALDKGEVDIVISGMAITQERNLNYLFAGPYLVSGKSILTKNRRIIQSSMDELNTRRIRVATLKGSTSATYVKKNLSETDLTLVDSYDEAVEMVIDESVDFMLADYSECAFASFRNQDKGLLIKEELLNIERTGIAIPSDDYLLLNLIQNFIEDLEETGELEMMEDKWFRNGTWLSEIE